MTQERLALVVRQAADAVMPSHQELAEPEIVVIRTGVWFTVSDAKAQVVIGRSRDGYHLGLRNAEANRDVTAWSVALPSTAHALAAAEAALDRWLEIMETER